MNEGQKLLLDILRANIRNEKIDYEKNNTFHINEAIKYALMQEVNTFIPKDILRFLNQTLRNAIEDKNYRNIGMLIQLSEEGKRVFSSLILNGINPIPLKGILIKNLYPHPEQRPMGDIDILVKEDDFLTASRVIESLGYTNKSTTNDRHDEFINSSGVIIELHRHLLNHYMMEFDSDFDKVATLNLVDIYCCDVKLKGLSNENHFIFLIEHFASHFFESSITIKLLMDIGVFIKSYKMNYEYIENSLKNMHLLTLYKTLMHLVKKYFGISTDNIYSLEYEKLGEELLNEIFKKNIYKLSEVNNGSIYVKYKDMHTRGFIKDTIKYFEINHDRILYFYPFGRNKMLFYIAAFLFVIKRTKEKNLSIKNTTLDMKKSYDLAIERKELAKRLGLRKE